MLKQLKELGTSDLILKNKRFLLIIINILYEVPYIIYISYSLKNISV